MIVGNGWQAVQAGKPNFYLTARRAKHSKLRSTVSLPNGGTG